MSMAYQIIREHSGKYPKTPFNSISTFFKQIEKVNRIDIQDDEARCKLLSKPIIENKGAVFSERLQKNDR